MDKLEADLVIHTKCQIVFGFKGLPDECGCRYPIGCILQITSKIEIGKLYHPAIVIERRERQDLFVDME